MDPTVQVALISAIGVVLAAALGAAAILIPRFLDRKKATEQSTRIAKSVDTFDWSERLMDTLEQRAIRAEARVDWLEAELTRLRQGAEG